MNRGVRSHLGAGFWGYGGRGGVGVGSGWCCLGLRGLYVLCIF